MNEMINYSQFNVNAVSKVMELRGIDPRKFIKKMCGEDTHSTFKQYFNERFSVQKLVETCNFLQVPLDTFFKSVDEVNSLPEFEGIAISAREAELIRLRALLEEKEMRISDLKDTNQRLMELLAQSKVQ